MADYDEAQVETLLPVLWDEELRVYGMAEKVRLTSREQARPGSRDAISPELRTSYTNPKHAGGHMTACADMQRAWELADLTLRDRQILLMRYGLKWDQWDCADYYELNQSTIHRAEKAAIAKLADFLNTGKSKTLTSRRAALAAKTERQA